MRIIRSVRDTKGNTIQKQPQNGAGRIRCMKCQQLCTAVLRPDGSKVIQCQGCGAQYSSRGLSP